MKTLTQICKSVKEKVEGLKETLEDVIGIDVTALNPLGVVMCVYGGKEKLPVACQCAECYAALPKSAHSWSGLPTFGNEDTEFVKKLAAGGSGFSPAIGGNPKKTYGIKRECDYLNGISEVFRQPEWDSVHGDHMNYELKALGIKKPLSNTHIPMGKDKKSCL